MVVKQGNCHANRQASLNATSQRGTRRCKTEGTWLELDEPHLAHNGTFRAVKATQGFASSRKLHSTAKTYTLILLRRCTQATTLSFTVILKGKLSFKRLLLHEAKEKIHWHDIIILAGIEKGEIARICSKLRAVCFSSVPAKKQSTDGLEFINSSLVQTKRPNPRSDTS